MTALQEYEIPLETVLEFKYLGRLLKATDDDWSSVIDNIWKARNNWSRLAQILGKDVVDNRTLGSFYVVVVQAIQMFRLEMWVETHHIKRLLRGFYHRVAHQILGKMPWWHTEGTREYPPLGDAMMALGLEEIGTYIYRRQNKLVHYVANRPILDLCMDTERRPGYWALTR